MQGLEAALPVNNTYKQENRGDKVCVIPANMQQYQFNGKKYLQRGQEILNTSSSCS